MTTIVIHNGVVAYDSQLTNGGARERFGVEKVQMEKGRIFAFAGEPALYEPLKRWIIRGAKPENFPKVKRINRNPEYDIIEITTHGMRIWSDEHHTLPVTIVEPVCFGSGGDFARGAIELGKLLGIKVHAFDALQAAAEADIYTGYPLKAIDISKSLEMGSPVRRLRRRRSVK